MCVEEVGEEVDILRQKSEKRISNIVSLIKRNKGCAGLDMDTFFNE